MKKITIFIGTSRKGSTYNASQELIKNIEAYNQIDVEYVFIDDYNLKHCRGCKLCFNKGEEYCSLKDDRDILLEKINSSDGVIFASPNYAFQITATMKNFIDRIAFIFHRPQYFDKTFMSLVTQGIFGGKNIIKYLDTVGETLGFRVVKGCVITTLDPSTDKQKIENSKKIKKASIRFYKELNNSKLASPSLFRLMLFRMSRTSMKLILNDNYKDYMHFKEKGWFDSNYYYEVSLNYTKKLAGCIFDFIGKQIVKHR
jgi:multimeric flavodoxin WrbA